ncbi:MAG: 3'-5' exonuclease, partial [Luteibaculum sp.]
MNIPPADSILFIDLETVPQSPNFESLEPNSQEVWKQKVSYLITEERNEEQLYEDRAGIMAEFGKIVCATVAYLVADGDNYQIKLRSFYGEDEKQLLNDLIPVLK